MRLDRSYGSSGTSLADLDSEPVFNQHAVDELASLADLRKAPLVEEEYHGPLLFSADAAADTLRSLLGSAVTATRPALGTEARTNGPFASSYHARVLPDFMNVVDDPSLKTFNGKDLLGAHTTLTTKASPLRPSSLSTTAASTITSSAASPSATFLSPMATGAPASPARRVP